MSISRRSLLTAGLLAPIAIAGVTACSTGSTQSAGSAAPTGSSAAAVDAFPVTIRHAFGETVVNAQPRRIATTAWVNADVALALGVVPVGMAADDWGGNANSSTPWKDARLAELGASIGSPNAPKQYSETEGTPFDDIAAVQPDLILAAYSGITKADYERLSRIAPVIAYPEVAWGTSWQQSTTLIGQALGLSGPAAELVARTEALLASVPKDNPSIAGKTYIYGNLDTTQTPPIGIYTPLDNRPRFMQSIGMTMAPVVQKASEGKKAFNFTWSAEKAEELKSDLLLSWVADEKAKKAILADPLLSKIPAIESGNYFMDSDNTRTLALSAANPLSLPWAVQNVVPEIVRAVEA